MNILRHFISIAIFSIFFIFAGCGTFAKMSKAAFEPDPTEINIEFIASEDINPNAAGKPAPVVIRYYELKKDFAFKTNDFFNIFDKEKELFGDGLKRMEEYEIRPNDEVEIEFEAEEGAKYVAILAAFRDYQHLKWRVSQPLELNEKNNMKFILDEDGIHLKKRKWWQFFGIGY